jgi:hypothetical protein
MERIVVSEPGRQARSPASVALPSDNARLQLTLSGGMFSLVRLSEQNWATESFFTLLWREHGLFCGRPCSE